MEEIINKFNKEYSFVDTIIADFEKYLGIVYITIEKQKITGNKIENFESYVKTNNIN